jgi:hypothetical protein
MSDEPKHAGGRPSKYTLEMCERVIEVGREGGAVAEMAVACEVSIQTLYGWRDNHEEFFEAFMYGQALAEAFHSKRVRDGLSLAPSEFQGAANLKYMAQRFQDRWSEKQRLEHSGPNEGPIEVSQVPPSERMKAYLDGIAKRSGTDS